jgi:hypothetical protein
VGEGVKLLRPSGLSEVGEKVKLRPSGLSEVGVRASVRDQVVCAEREGWGDLELMLIQVARLPNENISYRINDNFHLGLFIFLRKPEAYKSGAQRV